MSTAVRAAGSRRALRLVLFGRNSAGKSSLLGALMQTAQVQERLLNGQLRDLSQGLTELQHRLYDGGPDDTTKEVAPYPVQFQPLDAGKKTRSIDAVLIDCDGQVATRLLERRQGLDDATAEGPLARAIMQADAIILVVDASAAPAQLDADFLQFERFLRLLEQSRGRQVEVTGQPILLALTKCDLLIRSGETTATRADWLNRMEERKHRVAELFREFLTRAWQQDALPFGQIHLEAVRPTAIRQPALADSPAKPDEPFGVAELFREGLADAQVYRSRRQQSNRSLFRTILSGVGLVVLMFGLLGGLIALAFNHHEPGPLEQEVSRYLAEGPQYEHVPQQIADLTEWTRDPVFESLPADRQQAIRQRLEELKTYQDYENRLNAITDPLKARTVTEVSDIANRLEQIHVPKAYTEDWRKTEAHEKQNTWLADASAMRSAGQQILGWYQTLVKDGQKVLNNAAASDLPGRARQVLDRSDQPPFPVHDPKQPLQGSKRATYATVLGLQSVADARRQWDEIKKRLQPIAMVGTGGD